MEEIENELSLCSNVQTIYDWAKYIYRKQSNVVILKTVYAPIANDIYGNPWFTVNGITAGQHQAAGRIWIISMNYHKKERSPAISNIEAATSFLRDFGMRSVER